MTDIDLEAVDASGLTPKQRVVFRELKRGKSPIQIAEKMEITAAGVYGHIRAIRAMISEEETVEDIEHSHSGNGNAVKALVPEGGYEAAVKMLDESLEAETTELKQAEERMQSLQRELEEVGEVRDMRRNRVVALEAARKSLGTELLAA